MPTTEPVKNNPRDHSKVAAILAEKHGFDIKAALEEGYTHKQVADYLAVKENTQDKFLELLLCPPKYLSTKVQNNIWMKKLSKKEREVDINKCMAQFFDMYALIAQDAMVYLLPPKDGLQDQTYISNAGLVLAHMYKTVILTNFRAPGRPGEEKELAKFMSIGDMDYEQFPCPHKFEGEADCKWIRDNIYVGGYGIRTDIKAYEWMEETFGMEITKVKMTDELRYHFDCNLFPLSRNKILFCTDGVPASTIKELEKISEIIPVTKEASQYSITNLLRVGSVVYCGTDISELNYDDDDYGPEKRKNEALEKIVRDAGLALVFINLSGIGVSGAALSCQILHLSYISYPD